MRKLPKTIYQTADQIDERIRNREQDAAKLPQGEMRQSILKEIAQLRMYAEAKRWTETANTKSGVYRPGERNDEGKTAG